MPNCVSCGSSITPAARFCPKCGQATAPANVVRPSAAAARLTVALACHYHSEAAVVGRCVDCGKAFCDTCDVPITHHGHICLDCGAIFARKKLRVAYWAAAIGVLPGIGLAGGAIASGSWYLAPLALCVYAYAFPAIYFGWHYGGKIWEKLFRFTDSFHGTAGFIAAMVALSMRLAAAFYIGIFGGGIVQFRRYRQIVGFHESLQAPPRSSAAAARTTSAGATQ